jgi:hypothetical protein
MVSSRTLRRVALVRTDVSEEFSASFIRVIRIGELGTTLAVTSNRRTLLLQESHAVNIPEDTILHSHRRENLQSYMVQGLAAGWTTERVVVRISEGPRTFTSPYCPDRLSGPSELSIQWVPGILPRG